MTQVLRLLSGSGRLRYYVAGLCCNRGYHFGWYLFNDPGPDGPNIMARCCYCGSTGKLDRGNSWSIIDIHPPYMGEEVTGG